VPGKNPRDAKVRLAKEIVALYHSVEAADEAEAYFVNTFSKRQQPVEAEEVAIPLDLVGDDGKLALAQLIATLGLAKSNGAAKDLIKAGAVGLDGEKVSEAVTRFTVDELRGRVLRVGKHQFRQLG
jgi:tyrosyl-tRNA synthetase